MNFNIQGQVPIEIEHTYQVTVEQWSLDNSTPTTVHKSAFGNTGTSQGVPDYQGSFRVPPIIGSPNGTEMDLDALSAQPGGFTISFPWGGRKYAATGCKISKITRSNTPGTGDAMTDVSYVPVDVVRIS